MGLFKRSKAWYCSITDANGNRIRKSLSRDKRIAEMIYGKIQERIAMQAVGLVSTAQPIVGRPPTLHEIRRQYLDHIKGLGRSASYEIAFDKVWRTFIEEPKLARLDGMTADMLQQMQSEKLGTGIKPQTINQRFNILRVFCVWAVKRGYMRTNPLADWTQLKPAEKDFRRDLGPDEIQRILDAEQDQELKLLWRVYFYTGLRRAAGASLEWEWIDWDNRMISLPSKNNKSRKPHRIPMHPELFKALAAWREKQRTTEGRVFSKRDSRIPKRAYYKLPKREIKFSDQEGDNILALFRKACKRAGVDLNGVCLHSTRHTFATMVYEATGGNLKATQEVLGHAGIATTANYLHVSDELKRDAIEGLTFEKKGDNGRGPGVLFFKKNDGDQGEEAREMGGLAGQA